MTNDELQEHIRALNEAAAKGLVQVKPPGAFQWRMVSNPMIGAEYRIKPQPQEVWIPSSCVADKCNHAVVYTESSLKDYPPQGWTHFREVMPGE